MKIQKVLAVYKVSPLLLMVESEEGKVFELSLQELSGADYSFSDTAWQSLSEDYQIFHSPSAPR